MSIEIKTRLDDKIYKSYGGGETRIWYEWVNGSMNLLTASRKLLEHRMLMLIGCGNIGCGRSWLTVNGIVIDDLDLPKNLDDARRLLDQVRSGTYVKNIEEARVLSIAEDAEEEAAEAAGYAGEPLPPGSPWHVCRGHALGVSSAQADQDHVAKLAADRQAEIERDLAESAQWAETQRLANLAAAEERRIIDARQAAKHIARNARRKSSLTVYKA